MPCTELALEMPEVNDAGVRLAILAPALAVCACETLAMNVRVIPVRRFRLASEDTLQPSAYTPAKVAMPSKLP